MDLEYEILEEIKAMFFELEEELLKLDLNNQEKIALSILKQKWSNYHTFVLKDLFELEKFHKYLNKYSNYEKYSKYVQNVGDYRTQMGYRRMFSFI